MGCLSSKKDPVEAYIEPSEKDPVEKRSSEKSEVGAVQRGSGHNARPSKASQSSKSSKRHSTAEGDDEAVAVKQGDRRKSEAGKAEDVNVPGMSLASESKAELPIVQPRRKSTTDATILCEMTLSQTEVQPFTQVEVRWKLKGQKANEADWIGMYEGVEVPEDIDNYVSSMMATGKMEGSVKFTAPNHPGLHHFRYFLLDDTEAAVSSAFTINKLDKAEAEENIHVRDAISAENEVKRIEGKVVDEDEEEEDLCPGDGAVERKKKKKPDAPKEFDDVTGFEVDENSTSQAVDQIDKWKEEAQRAQEVKEEQVMHAATNYVKKIPTKKEMRAQAAAKVAAVQGGPAPAPSRTSTEVAGGDGSEPAPKKKAGWGAVRSAVKVSASFQQGRANKQEDTFKNRKKAVAKGGADEMGSFVINRGKK